MSAPVNSSGSIRRRLSLLLVGSAAVLATILFVLVQNFVREVSEQSQDNILTASATSILDSASIVAGEISVDIPYAALSMLGNVSEDQVYYRITAGEDFLTGYSDLPRYEPPVEQQHTRRERNFITAQYKGNSIRMISATRLLPVLGEAVRITVSVAQTRNGQAETLARISRAALILGLGFFIISATMAMFAAQASVRPLQRLAISVSRRGPEDLRPVQSPVPAEMVPLVGSLNSFIARLKTSLARSEEFIAEAAHRVRTPLATVRAQAEVVLRRVDDQPKTRKSLKEMILAIDESSRAAGQLLDHAMVTFRTDHLECTSFDLTDLALDTVERMRPVASLRDIEIEVQPGDENHILGDSILIQSAVQNILDNAIKYSPPEQTITVCIQRLNGDIRVQISDRGPGFPAINSMRLTERFTRGDNAADTVGSGLGLTIAKEVVEAHGGKLTLNNQQQGGGACVSLYFPC